MPGEFLVSQTEAADFLRMSADDPERSSTGKLTEVLSTAHEQVEHRIGPLSTDEIEIVVHQPGPTLVLPLKGLAAVVAVSDADGREVPAGAITANLRAGIVTLADHGNAPWTVTVTSPERTASVRQAIKIIVAHLWETQRGRAGGGARGTAYSTAADVPDGMPAQGFAIPRRAQQLLAPYALTGV